MYEETFPIAEVLVSSVSLSAAAMLAIVFCMFRDLGKQITAINSTLEELRKEVKAHFDKIDDHFDKIDDHFDKFNDYFYSRRKETSAQTG